MRTVRLGRTDLDVTPIAFGTWQLGGDWGRFDEREAVAAIRQARELGINLFDTAQAYGFGASEQLTEIARQMVGRWGMSSAVGPVAVLPSDGRPLQPRVAGASEEPTRIVDVECGGSWTARSTTCPHFSRSTGTSWRRSPAR